MFVGHGVIVHSCSDKLYILTPAEGAAAVGDTKFETICLLSLSLCKSKRTDSNDTHYRFELSAVVDMSSLSGHAIHMHRHLDTLSAGTFFFMCCCPTTHGSSKKLPSLLPPKEQHNVYVDYIDTKWHLRGHPQVANIPSLSYTAAAQESLPRRRYA